MAKLIRKALERLQYEEVPVVSESTGIIPHAPEVSYREERTAHRPQPVSSGPLHAQDLCIEAAFARSPHDGSGGRGSVLHSQAMTELTPTPSSKIPVSAGEFEELFQEDVMDAIYSDPTVSQMISGASAMDGATTLVEAISQLTEMVEYLTSLVNEGWELNEPITEDEGWAFNTAKITEIEELTRAALSEEYEVVEESADFWREQT